MIGQQGLGKSNFLEFVNYDLGRMVRAGELKRLAHVYLRSQQLHPRTFADILVQAIGEARMVLLMRSLTQSDLPTSVHSTDLHRFVGVVEHWRNGKWPNFDPVEPARLMMRWLGGHQTYASERRNYAIAGRERLPPAVSFLYLPVLLDGLSQYGILDRLVVLMDEFEDIQAQNRAAQASYITTLKTLVNAFNWKRLFVVLAGTETVFATIGPRYPSLSQRWTQVRLLPLETSVEALRLARQYKAEAHAAFCREEGVEKNVIRLLFPEEAHVEAAFYKLQASSPTRTVTQRDFLAALHDRVEKHLSSST